MSDFQWTPLNDFEEELVAAQPQQDFIFGTQLAEDAHMFKPRPRRHLELAAKQREKQRIIQENCEKFPLHSGQRHKLETIATVQRIAKTKNLDQLPQVSDWDDNVDQERESIAMMRHYGMGPSIEGPLNEKITRNTNTNSAKYLIVKDKMGSLPVFFDSEYFKLQPRTLDETKKDANQNTSTASTSSASVSVSSSSTDSENNSYSSSQHILKHQQEIDQFEYALLNNSSDSSDILTTSSGSMF